jgi:hypothetical protein
LLRTTLLDSIQSRLILSPDRKDLAVLRRMRFVGAAIVVAALASAMMHRASAIGYFNLPGTCCQWNGYGCGAGYHAPLVLGPAHWYGHPWHSVVRLPYPPCSSGCNRECSGGDGGWGCNVNEPTRLEPVVAPTTAPGPAVEEPVPAPAAFRVPFRY